MGGYADRVQTEAVSTVKVDPGDPGTADVQMNFKAGQWGEYVVEMNSRVSREDLPRLVMDLYACVTPGPLRDALLDSLRGLG